MKFRRANNSGEQGSVLLITLVTASIIGGLLASYLTMISGAHRMTMRSLAWNSALVHAETGIEEAMTRLEADGVASTRNGWALQGSIYRKQRNFEDGYYIVEIQNVDPPRVTSTGFSKSPMTDDRYLQRTIRVQTTNNSLFARGMVAKDSIDLNGNRIRTDSFDSSDPRHSLLGLYNPLTAKDNGDVVTSSGLVDALKVGNADVYGKVSTGPGGSVSIGNNGAVGDKAWHNGGNLGIQPGKFTDDMNLSFPNVDIPFTTGLLPVAGILNGTLYHHVFSGPSLASANPTPYVMSSVDLSGSANVAIVGHVKIYVPGNFKMAGLSSITIVPGGKLELYVGGAETSIAGNGILNSVGLAQNFLYYGLPTNKSISFSGNALPNAAIYAPNASVTLNGGGNPDSIYDICGAIVANSVRVNGHFNFHYDEILAKVGPSRGYKVISWLED